MLWRIASGKDRLKKRMLRDKLTKNRSSPEQTSDLVDISLPGGKTVLSVSKEAIIFQPFIRDRETRNSNMETRNKYK